jgi:predicted RNase H-like nuclease (RuvC/YqgF family)
MSNNFYDACANVFNHPEYQAELLEAKALRGELSKLKDEYIEQVKKEAGYLTRIGDLEKLVQEQTRMAENLKREGATSRACGTLPCSGIPRSVTLGYTCLGS